MNRCRCPFLARLDAADDRVRCPLPKPTRWIVDTAEEFLKGRGSDVQVTAEGTVQRIAGWAAGPDFEEAVVMAAAAR